MRRKKEEARRLGCLLWVRFLKPVIFLACYCRITWLLNVDFSQLLLTVERVRCEAADTRHDQCRGPRRASPIPFYLL